MWIDAPYSASMHPKIIPFQIFLKNKRVKVYSNTHVKFGWNWIKLNFVCVAVAPKPSMSLSVSGNADKSSGQPVSNSDANGNAGDSKPAGSPAPKTRPKLAAKPQRRQPENLPTDKLRDVLAELVKTEESYVVKLSLLVAFKSDLRRRANEGANLGVDLRTLEQMIPVAVESIRAYHANMLLPTFQKVYSSMLGVSWQSTLTAVDNDIIQLACGNATSNAPRDAENVATQSVMQVSTVLSDCSKLSQVSVLLSAQIHPVFSFKLPSF